MNFLDQPVLAALMINATHYVDIGAGNDAVIYYQDAETAHMRLPDGAVLSGKWTLGNDGYDIIWTNGPEGSWQLSHVPGRIGYVDGSGKDHGPVKKIIYGNPEGLPN